MSQLSPSYHTGHHQEELTAIHLKRTHHKFEQTQNSSLSLFPEVSSKSELSNTKNENKLRQVNLVNGQQTKLTILCSRTMGKWDMKKHGFAS